MRWECSGGFFRRAYFCAEASVRNRQSMSLSSGMSSEIFSCSFASRISASKLLFATRLSTFRERGEKSWDFHRSVSADVQVVAHDREALRLVVFQKSNSLQGRS